MRPERGKRLQRQALRQLARTRFSRLLEPQQRQCHQGRGPFGPGIARVDWLVFRFARRDRRWRMREQQTPQRLAPAPQPLGTLHIQQQRLIQHRHIRREVQRPPAMGLHGQCRHGGELRLIERQTPCHPMHAEAPPVADV